MPFVRRRVPFVQTYTREPATEPIAQSSRSSINITTTTWCGRFWQRGTSAGRMSVAKSDMLANHRPTGQRPPSQNIPERKAEDQRDQFQLCMCEVLRSVIFFAV